MPYSVSDFAGLLKQKYPVYVQMPDDELVARVVSKYPQYQSQVQLDPRTEIKIRNLAPAPPQPDQPGIVHRFLTGAGIPTNVEEMQATADALDPGVQLARGNMAALGGPAGLAATGLLKRISSDVGTQADEAQGALQRGQYGSALAHAAAATAPLVGPQLAEGNVAGAAGTLTSLAAPEMAGRMMAGRATATATKSGPLTESIGSRIAARGGDVFNPQDTVVVPKFKTGPNAVQNQIEALAQKYPNATVYDEGDSLRIEADRPKQAAAAAAETVPAALHGYGIASVVAKHPIATITGGVIGWGMGHPFLGAEAGYLAAEGVQRMIQSPLWKATSSAVKSSVGKAMAAKEFGTVSAVASRVLGGQDLHDDYGHDSALWSLIQSLPPDVQSSPQALNQKLQQYDAVYVNPDGTAVQVPYHVQRQMVNKLTTGQQ